MTHALGEIRSLCTRASRAAGYDWGLAEEAGHAAAWLEAQGAPGGEALARLCDLALGGPIRACPLRAGAALVDGPDAPPPEIALELPLLFVPFLARVCAKAEGWAFAWPGAAGRVGRESLLVSAGPEALLTARATVGIRRLPAAPEPAPRRIRAIAGAWTLARLEHVAARLLAPSDPVSRRFGAGAEGAEPD